MAAVNVTAFPEVNGMRYERLLLPLLPISLLCGALSIVSAACGSSSAGAGGSANDCFDYTSFNGMSPAVSFQKDVLPIFQQSCGLSSVCHGCDPSMSPGCTTPGFKPFLGISLAAGAPTTQQIAAIISSVQLPAGTQMSTTADGNLVGEPSMAIVKPGDPSNSFMMYKLDGNFPMVPNDMTEVTCSKLACAKTMTCGQAMPNGGMSLPEANRDTIRRWIAQGAKND